MVVFELKRQISALNSLLHWLNHYAWNSSHNIIDITVEIGISLKHEQQWSNILHF